MHNASPIDAARAAADHLSRVQGPNGLQAAILALLIEKDNERARLAWEAEVQGTPEASALGEHVARLPPAARLPWFETLVSRMRGQPLERRQVLLEATRRLMAARGPMRPIDKLHWLSMRQRLGGAATAGAHRAASADLSLLPQADVETIARYTAFLARVIPVDTSADGEDPAPGAAWYDTVMQPWQEGADVPPCQPPDTDGLVHAVQELQAMAWMQRPMLVRAWTAAALQHGRHGRLAHAGADALRLTCSLLDCPLPPELARHHVEASAENGA
jgi:hypothetical protein